MIISRAYKQLGPICPLFTTNCMSVKTTLYFFSTIIALVLHTGVVTMPYPGYTYYSLRVSNVEPQNTFSMIAYPSSYRTRLLNLSMLPLMFIFEMNDLFILLNQ